MTREIDRLNNIIESKNRDIQDLEMRNAEGEQIARQFHNLRDQFSKMTG